MLKVEVDIKFETLKQGWDYEDVTDIHVDFESSLIRAIILVYTFMNTFTGKKIKIFGCYFHLV